MGGLELGDLGKGFVDFAKRRELRHVSAPPGKLGNQLWYARCASALVEEKNVRGPRRSRTTSHYLRFH